MRIKSKWFQSGSVKTPEQTASAMAFITWRIAQNTLKQMRLAKFDIEVGPQYFAFTREMLVFFLLLLDRLAYQRMGSDDRAAFVTALVRREAEILEENEDSFLGPPPQGQRPHSETFIDLFNELSEHYAEFGFDHDGRDFAFVRYLGHRIERIMPAKDQRWVIEQMMAAEVPEAFVLLERAMSGVLSNEPRPSRRVPAVTSGD